MHMYVYMHVYTHRTINLNSIHIYIRITYLACL